MNRLILSFVLSVLVSVIGIAFALILHMLSSIFSAYGNIVIYGSTAFLVLWILIYFSSLSKTGDQ